MPTAHQDDAGTRERLLEAAAEVFDEHGFRAATVRDICRRARANVAAVNYHFGGKEALYHEVLERALNAALQRYPPDLGLGERSTPEERLHAFVRSFLLRLLVDGLPASVMRLLMREMVEPTGALERLVESVHVPLFQRLRGIVAQVAGPDASVPGILRCSQAVIAQCVFYRHAAPVLELMGQRIPRSAADVDALAEHVTRFSLAGIRAAAGPREVA